MLLFASEVSIADAALGAHRLGLPASYGRYTEEQVRQAAAQLKGQGQDVNEVTLLTTLQAAEMQEAVHKAQVSARVVWAGF